jgi:hypothetical protein
MLRILAIAGVQQPTTEVIVGTSGRPVELLLAGSGCQDAVAADLAGDLLLTDGNIENLKKAHDFAMVRPEHFSASDYVELPIRIFFFMQSVIAHSWKQAEELKTLACDRKELATLKRRVDDGETEISHLEKVNAELQRQLEEQKKALEAHQEQLKEQKKAHQSKPLLPSSTYTERLTLGSEKLSTTELRKMLVYKEELLTDVKNLLYRRTDDIERLQKVIDDTERQFVDCLQQIKALGEKDEQQRKELEDLRGAAQELVDMVDPPEEGEASPRSLLERLREAPKKVLKFLSEAPVACVSNTLAYVKSFLPCAQLDIFTQGMAADCMDERFDEYLREAQPVAEQIVHSVL